jgi:plasmid stability protein
MKRLVLELDDEFHQKIKVKAAQLNRTVRDILTEFLKDWVRKSK